MWKCGIRKEPDKHLIESGCVIAFGSPFVYNLNSAPVRVSLSVLVRPDGHKDWRGAFNEV